MLIQEYHLLYTDRTSHGQLLKFRDPIPQQCVIALVILQAYYGTYLVEPGPHSKEFILDWDLWMNVTHKEVQQ